MFATVPPVNKSLCVDEPPALVAIWIVPLLVDGFADVTSASPDIAILPEELIVPVLMALPVPVFCTMPPDMLTGLVVATYMALPVLVFVTVPPVMLSAVTLPPVM